jgi:hypothetical protein
LATSFFAITFGYSLRFKQSFITAAGLSLVISLIALVTPSRTQGQGGNQQPLNVNVINPAAAPALVRDVNNVARPRFSATKFCDISHLELTQVCTIATAPPDKQVVIEYVSVRARMEPGVLPFAQINATQTHAPSGMAQTWRFPHIMTPQGTFENNGALRDFYVSSQLVRFYVDPGQPVALEVDRSIHGTLAVGFTVTISGYFVDAPQ